MKKLLIAIFVLVIIGGAVYFLNDSDLSSKLPPTTPEDTQNKKSGEAGLNNTSATNGGGIEPAMMEDGTIEEKTGVESILPKPINKDSIVTGNLEAPAPVEVTYTDKGFSPETITLNQGATVKFINKSASGMWVASNPHPQHTDYSAFDARTPVPPNASYSFTFTKRGIWKYHNHVNSPHGGTITIE